MSQNIVDKVVKNVFPVGSIITFCNDTNPNELFEGKWNLLGQYANPILYDSIELVRGLSGSTHVDRTYLLGSYYNYCAWLSNFSNECPSAYYLVARLKIYGQTDGSNIITVYLNNKSVDLRTWGPATYTAVSNAGGWWPWDSLLPDDITYGIDNGEKGINLSYQVSTPDLGWAIHSITLDLGFMPYDTKREWARVS